VLLLNNGTNYSLAIQPPDREKKPPPYQFYSFSLSHAIDTMEFKKQPASVFLHFILTETPGHVQEPKST
jgi:hypothetical protein